MAVKNFNFKIPGGQTAAVLKIDKLQYLMMMQNGGPIYKMSYDNLLIILR